jgi:hypothetical protein
LGRRRNIWVGAIRMRPVHAKGTRHLNRDPTTNDVEN